MVDLESNSWDAARQACLDQGADLVSIHSAEESAFVSSLVSDELEWDLAWLGGTDYATQRTWSWSDGSTWGDWERGGGSWDSDEPSDGYSDTRGREDCMVIIGAGSRYFDPSRTQWHDTYCTAYAASYDTVGYICKRSGTKHILYPR